MKIPKRFKEDDHTVHDFLVKYFPHCFVLDADQDEKVGPLKDEIFKWCEETFGPSLFTIDPNRNRFHHLQNKEAVWDYWCDEIFFASNHQCTLFKLAWGDDYIRQKR